MRHPSHVFVFVLLLCGAAAAPALAERGTGDLALVVERAAGSVLVVDTTKLAVLGKIPGLGDLSHASAVFSRDQRFAYVFGRDGGLTKVDLLGLRIEKRIVQSGNSIGGAVSQDGKWIAVSNYTPGGVKIFSAETLDLHADFPSGPSTAPNKVVGIVDLPGNRFAAATYESGEAWLLEPTAPGAWRVRKWNAGKFPYDAGITPDGRFYIVGLFGEDGLALLDTWNPDAGLRKIVPEFAKDDPKLPVFKMPHLEGWGMAGRHSFLPAVGRHEVLVVDRETWKVTARVPVAGQPVFCVASPDGRTVWVNFAVPDYGTVQVIDVATLKPVKTLTPGKAILHIEFSPKGEDVWLSDRDGDKLLVYDAYTYEKRGELTADKPSGIFFTARAQRIGM